MNGYFVRQEIQQLLDNIEMLKQRQALLRADDPENAVISTEVQAIEDTIESMDFELEDLAEQLAKAISNIEIDADAYEKEARKWTEKAIAAKARLKREKDLLKYILESNDIKSMKAGIFKLTVAGNGGKTPIIYNVEPDELPDQFRKDVVTKKADDKAIREFLDNGGKSDYFRYGERGTSLRIR